MNTDIIDKLNKNRNNPTTALIRDMVVDVVGTVQVAKRGSQYFKEKLALIKYTHWEYPLYYIVLYNNSIPSTQAIISEASSMDYSVVEISNELFCCMDEAIKFTNDNQSIDTNPYTMLVTYCLLKGFDIRPLI